MPASKKDDALRKQARLVFKGTVASLGKSNVAEVDAGPDTVMVHVDELLHAPEVMSGLAGNLVTVKLAAKESVKAGEHAVFYTNSLVMSDNVALQSVGHLPVQGAAFAMTGDTRDAVQSLQDEDVRQRLESADTVLSGKVLSVRLPAAAARRSGTRGLAADTAPRTEPISEHNPEWREAVIQVHSVEKGKLKGKQTVIRFPASNDVRWHRAPKFEAGQEGVFILHKPEAAKPARGTKRRGLAPAVAADEIGASEFTALSPTDFQPLQKHAEIRTLLKGSRS